MRIDLIPGLYRARIYYDNLDKLSEDRLDGDDFYEIYLWRTNENEGVFIIRDRESS